MADDRGPSVKSARIEVRMGDVQVVLEGEPEFVMTAYREVQEGLSRAFAESVTAKAEPRREPKDYDEAHSVASRAPARSGEKARRDILWLSRCEDGVRKVYAAPRRGFAGSRFAKSFGLGAVNHVFVDDDRLLRALKHDAETLWLVVDPALPQ
jgi:hypothetical protein